MPQERAYSYNLSPFLEIRRFWMYRDRLSAFAVAANLVGNVVGFVPFGLILPIVCPRADSFFRVFLLSLDFSLCVEFIQLIFRVGSFDVDDLILNTLGGILGYFLYRLCDNVRIKINRRLSRRMRHG